MASAMTCSKDFLFTSSIGCIKVSGDGYGRCVLGMGCHHSGCGLMAGVCVRYGMPSL